MTRRPPTARMCRTLKRVTPPHWLKVVCRIVKDHKALRPSRPREAGPATLSPSSSIRLVREGFACNRGFLDFAQPHVSRAKGMIGGRNAGCQGFPQRIWETAPGASHPAVLEVEPRDQNPAVARGMGACWRAPPCTWSGRSIQRDYDGGNRLGQALKSSFHRKSTRWPRRGF
jgi:hypothetical protein